MKRRVNKSSMRNLSSLFIGTAFKAHSFIAAIRVALLYTANSTYARPCIFLSFLGGPVSCLYTHIIQPPTQIPPFSNPTSSLLRQWREQSALHQYPSVSSSCSFFFDAPDKRRSWVALRVSEVDDQRKVAAAMNQSAIDVFRFAGNRTNGWPRARCR